MEKPNNWVTSRTKALQVLEALPPNSPQRFEFLRALLRRCDTASLIDLNHNLAKEMLKILELQEMEKLVEEVSAQARAKEADRERQMHSSELQKQQEAVSETRGKETEIKNRTKRIRFSDDTVGGENEEAPSSPEEGEIIEPDQDLCWIPIVKELLEELMSMEGAKFLCKRRSEKASSESQTETKIKSPPRTPEPDLKSAQGLNIKSILKRRPKVVATSDCEQTYHSIDSIKEKLDSELYPDPMEFHDDMNLMFIYFEPFLTEEESNLVNLIKLMYYSTIYELIIEFSSVVKHYKV